MISYAFDFDNFQGKSNSKPTRHKTQISAYFISSASQSRSKSVKQLVSLLPPALACYYIRERLALIANACLLTYYDYDSVMLMVILILILTGRDAVGQRR